MRGYIRTMDGREHHVGRIERPIECFRCGLCCLRYQPKLTIEEVQELAGRLALAVDDFISRYVQVTVVGYLLRQTKRGCIFFAWDEAGTRATCTIHPIRPEACRNWVPSLSRPECQEGLTRLKTGNQVISVREIYPTPEEIQKLYESLK